MPLVSIDLSPTQYRFNQSNPLSEGMGRLQEAIILGLTKRREMEAERERQKRNDQRLDARELRQDRMDRAALERQGRMDEVAEEQRLIGNDRNRAQDIRQANLDTQGRERQGWQDFITETERTENRRRYDENLNVEAIKEMNRADERRAARDLLVEKRGSLSESEARRLAPSWAKTRAGKDEWGASLPVSEQDLEDAYQELRAGPPQPVRKVPPTDPQTQRQVFDVLEGAKPPAPTPARAPVAEEGGGFLSDLWGYTKDGWDTLFGGSDDDFSRRALTDSAIGDAVDAAGGPVEEIAPTSGANVSAAGGSITEDPADQPINDLAAIFQRTTGSIPEDPAVIDDLLGEDAEAVARRMDQIPPAARKKVAIYLLKLRQERNRASPAAQ